MAPLAAALPVFDRRRMAARPARPTGPVPTIARDEGSGAAGKGDPDASSAIMTSPLPVRTPAARIWFTPASHEPPPPPAPPPLLAPPPPQYPPPPPKPPDPGGVPQRPSGHHHRSQDQCRDRALVRLRGAASRRPYRRSSRLTIRLQPRRKHPTASVGRKYAVPSRYA